MKLIDSLTPSEAINTIGFKPVRFLKSDRFEDIFVISSDSEEPQYNKKCYYMRCFLRQHDKNKRNDKRKIC